jgi:uroporphyrin-III C-methyltransferase / precorrin-2 dehydrogenase / sirohydrochlorin ferrochelatase
MLLPINLNVQGRLCAVVGGGDVARRKIQKLHECGARVRIVSPKLDPALDAWIAEAEACTGIEWREKSYAPEDLEDAFLVIAATNEPDVNTQVADDARRLGILQQQVDLPEDCDFTFPAVHRSGGLSVSIATEGGSPTLSARLRQEAESLFDEAFVRLLGIVARIQKEPVWSELDESQRRAAIRRIRASRILDLLRDATPEDSPERTEQAALQIARQCVDEIAASRPRGIVYLVGAGPGDSGLLTLRGAECLMAADVVLVDAIVNRALLHRFAPSAEWIDVGKRKGARRTPQDRINRLLIEHVRQGRVVVRLKGGDPFVLGRGGEEGRALHDAGVRFEVVPGVSSATAVPAYAGIPVTDREHASSFGVFSMHRRGEFDFDEEEWRRIAQGPETLLLFMGRTILPAIVEKLKQYGRSVDTPVALIINGTTPHQERFVGTLDDIVAKIGERKFKGPGLIVVGRVIETMESLDWFTPYLSRSFESEDS